MQSEIGSNFWLSPDDVIGSNVIPSPDVFNCAGSDYVWLSTCRSAIELVIRTIEQRNPNVKKVVCLPAFTCHTVLEPFVKAGYKIITLPLDEDLTSSTREILKIIEKTTVGIVLFHRYFGFDTLPGIDEVLPVLQKKNVIVIEDCTQSLYSSFNRMAADYFVGSIRKWCGVPDGGFAVCKDGAFTDKPMRSDIALERAKRVASEMKYRYLFLYAGDKDTYLTRYRDAENLLDNQSQIYAIGELSKIVQRNLDICQMKIKRRRNYQTLLQVLKDIDGITPLFGRMENGDVPLYFPILCDDREKIQKLLVKNAVYAPIIWPKNEIFSRVSEKVEYVYEHLLCIPIDQRYDTDDMERIGAIMKNMDIQYDWMKWEDILPYKEQLIQLEHELMIRYHYPDKIISVDYPSSRVENLKEHVMSGNTFFWAACRGNELLGYMWCYTSPFIDIKRWNIRSIMFKSSAQSLGLGHIALEEGERKALEIGCTEICTEYVPFNDHMAHVMEREGFEVTRVEVVKRLNRDN